MQTKIPFHVKIREAGGGQVSSFQFTIYTCPATDFFTLRLIRL